MALEISSSCSISAVGDILVVREEEEALITEIKTGSVFAALLILGVN